MPPASSSPPPDPTDVPGPPDSSSERHLINRARRGSRSAVNALFAGHAPWLRAWVLGRLPHWARDFAGTSDLVQDALQHTLTRLTSCRGRVSRRQLKVGDDSNTLPRLPRLGKRAVLFIEVRLQHPEILIPGDAATGTSARPC